MKDKKNFIPALRVGLLTKLFDPFLNLTMAERKFKGMLIQLASIKENERVLDFGCGTGTLALMVKESVPNAQVFGVDVDPKILEIANVKVNNSPHEIQLLEYDGDTLPYEDNSMDKVLTSLVFHHLYRNQKVKALEEIYRVLKTEGEFHIVDFGKARNILMRSLFFPMQLLDGISNTQDNIKGRVPELISGAGFKEVTEEKRVMTVFGTLSFYSAKKL